MQKYIAELVGTFWLVLGGCGSAVLAAGFPEVGIGLLGVSLAFGLTVLTMAYAVGGISGGHFNPAVSLGLAVAGRFEMRSLLPYWAAQVAGAIAASVILFLIVSGKADFSGVGGFASNGYGSASPGGYGLLSGLVTEVVPQKGLMDRARELARLMGSRAPMAFVTGRDAVLRSTETDLLTGIDFERKLYALLMATEDKAEGLAAYREKREPRYTGR